MNEQVLQTLKNTATKKTTYESIVEYYQLSNPDEDGIDFRDYFDGDIDDAYDAGSSDGAIEFARAILNQLGIEYDK